MQGNCVSALPCVGFALCLGDTGRHPLSRTEPVTRTLQVWARGPGDGLQWLSGLR